MELTLREVQGRRLVEGVPGQPMIGRAEDIRTMLEACFDQAVDRLMLYPENLPAHFFDLSSGQAGAILQKLRNYGIRLAIVRSPTLHLSQRFGELLTDEQRGPYFRLFDTRDAAESWLCFD